MWGQIKPGKKKNIKLNSDKFAIMHSQHLNIHTLDFLSEKKCLPYNPTLKDYEIRLSEELGVTVMLICMKMKVKLTQLCPTLYSLWNSSRQNTEVGSLSLLQGIFATQGSNPGLPHCRRVLCQISQQQNPYM